MIHVYLDDMRPCPAGFVAAKHAEECILLLQEYEVDVLSLDYDLGWTSQETGMDVVIWMLEKRRFSRSIYLHSSNMSARSHMYQMLYMGKPDSVRVHSIPVPESLLRRIAQGER